MAYQGICGALVSGCFRCSEDGRYNRDFSMKESRVCFICGHPSHVKADYPLREAGVVLDPTHLASQLSNGGYRIVGVPRTRF